MIRTFRNRDTERAFKGARVRSLPQDIRRRVQRQLIRVHTVVDLLELNTPPSNRLEALKGDRKGQWSVRVNDQWRICFEWKDGDAYDVEIVDYH
jgi:proteic killer suppression protein